MWYLKWLFQTTQDLRMYWCSFSAGFLLYLPNAAWWLPCESNLCKDGGLESSDCWSSAALAEFLSFRLLPATERTESKKIQFSFAWVLHAFIYNRPHSKHLANLPSFLQSTNNGFKGFLIIFSVRYQKFWIYSRKKLNCSHYICSHLDNMLKTIEDIYFFIIPPLNVKLLQWFQLMVP